MSAFEPKDKRKRNDSDDDETAEKKSKIVDNPTIHFKIEDGINLIFNDKTDLGIGGFEPERDYGPIEKNNNTRFFPPTVTRKRNCCFILIPSKEKALYLNSFISDQDDDNMKKYKILKTFEKIKKFDISPDTYAYAVFLDTPNKNTSQQNDNYFHNDSPAITVLNQDVQTMLKELEITHTKKEDDKYTPKQSNYTLIEYRRDCVSTTVINRLDKNDYIRFWACNGTVICIENITQQHSTPFVISDDNVIGRKPGNNTIIKHKSDNSTNRELYRTQIIPIENEDLINNIEKNHTGNFEVLDFNDNETWKTYNKLKPFQQMEYNDYISNLENRKYEAGKKIRKTRKGKKSRKTKKSRKSRKTK
jgi:hypothetical protein